MTPAISVMSDLLIIGSGGGALTAAVTARCN